MKLKIVNLKKFVFSVVFILGIIIILSIIFSKQSFSHGEEKYKTIFVSEGDTLWSIAVSEINSNNYYENKDIRTVINNIKIINNLDSSSLYVGQELLILSEI